MRIRSLCLALAAVALAAPALAAQSWSSQSLAPRPPNEEVFPAAPRRADLTVNITPPAGVYVGDPGTYQVVVSNTGNHSANVCRLTITLPRTNTSPTVHVLGTLGAYDSRCSRSGTNLICDLGTLGRGVSASRSFTISLPQSSAPIVVGASVTTESTELSTSNNSDSDTAYLLHPFFTVSAGQFAHVDHCTGTALTSFFECMLYPSSISSHEFNVLSGGTLAFVDAPASYWGTWSQSLGLDRLVLEYYDGTSHEASFSGWAVGGGCFEGVTTFYPPSVYVAPYRVCLN